jgi:hypothetical protein
MEAEDELSIEMENLRKTMEKYEEDGGSLSTEQFKNTFNEINEIKKRIFAQGIFSENEDFTEIKTESIKFMLISYYQSELMQKFMENRESTLNFALHFYDEFYKLLDKHNYLVKDRKDMYKKLTKKNEDEDESNKGKPSMEEMSKEREEKILAFKYKKILSEKLKVK